MSQKRQVEPDWVVRTHVVGLSAGTSIPPHTHDWDQLVYASRGVLSVQAEAGAWVVPPERAVWVPAGTEHALETSGSVRLATLYLSPELPLRLPRRCTVVHIAPLVRELILHTTREGMLDRGVPRHRRLLEFLLDQLSELPSVPLRLPSPSDPRARKAASLLRSDPAISASAEELAQAAGASKRTLERLFLTETGLTFGRWRQQLRLLEALKRLAAGEPVTTVALRVGYESPSAFISMFRGALGETPGRYYSAPAQRASG